MMLAAVVGRAEQHLVLLYLACLSGWTFLALVSCSLAGDSTFRLWILWSPVLQQVTAHLDCGYFGLLFFSR